MDDNEFKYHLLSLHKTALRAKLCRIWQNA